MKVKKELKLVQINMKKIIFIIIIIWAQSSYAQKKVNLLEEDEEIKSILSSTALGGINTLTPNQLAVNNQEKDTRVVGYTGTKCP